MTLLSWAFFNGAEVVTAGGISRFEEDWAFEREALLTELNRPIWEPVKPPAAAAHMNGMSTLAPVVTAQRCGEEKRFLVPKDDYDTRSDSKELGAQRTAHVHRGPVAPPGAAAGAREAEDDRPTFPRRRDLQADRPAAKPCGE